MIENWYIVIALICVGGATGIAIYKFAKIPTNEQKNKVKEWLLYAVTMAEKELGGGTGKLKLRMVYGMFIDKFPAISQAVSFETFSEWVDVALDEMKKMLADNEAVKLFVEK